MPAMDVAEAELANAMIATIGGTRPTMLPAQVRQYLSHFFHIQDGNIQIKRYSRADFLLIFASRQLVDQALHAVQPKDVGFLLVF
jgi:hypothetical protein